MIQEGNLINNSCYVQTNEIPILQNLPFVRIEDESHNLINGEYVPMDIRNFHQQVHPQILDNSFQPEMPIYFDGDQFQQQQQQPQTSQLNQEFSFFNSSIYEAPKIEETPIKDNTMSDNSDASTTEGDINPAEEQYAYLKELNSENLMQISQQSVLQEMILKEHLQGKTNLNNLPIFEEHDIGNYNFKLNIPSHQKSSKRNWMYSEQFNKVYIRMNDIFTIDATYTPKMPLQQLRIRTFISFVKEVSEPVKRCQNHLSKDCETQNTKRESLLRCENPDAEYSGSSEGKTVKERYSVSIPLNMCALQNDNTVKQPIALKFTCQNSCIGRKETCIMFLLEGMNGEILAQRLLNVRICSCPKRDKQLDEKNSTTKRKNDCDLYQTDPKICKREPLSPESPTLKDDNSCSDYENAAKLFDMQRTANGGYRLVMELSTKENVLFTINTACARECLNIVDNSKEAPLSKQCFHNLKKLYATCANLE